MTIDITAFDSVGKSEQGQPLMLKHEDGITDTGITLIVLGRHADSVTKFTSRLMRDAMRDQQMAARRGKTVEPKTLEEVKEQNVSAAAVRVTGWDGVKQPYSEDLLKSALKRNPHWVDQIIEFSDDLGNFTSGSVKN